MKNTKKVRNYVNNKDLFDAMVVYKDNVNSWKLNPVGEKPQIPKYVAECIMIIAERVSRKGNFGGYTYREDMVGDAIENCVRYIDNFSPNYVDKHGETRQGNAFAYFTQIITFCFIRRISKEKIQQYTKYKNMGHLYSQEDLLSSNAIDRNDTIFSDVIKNFEDAAIAKKLKKENIKLDTIT